MIALLTDPWFEAEFYGNARGQSFRRQGSSIDGAQGIFLWCPCGFSKPNKCCHGLIVPFVNPRNAPPLPAEHGPTSRDGSHHPRWNMKSSGLADLTLAPSVDVGETSCWHGFIRNGEVL